MNTTIQTLAGFKHHLTDYDSVLRDFSWEKEAMFLSHLPENAGLNIGYNAVDRHVDHQNRNTVALRWIRKDRSVQNFTYGDLKNLTAQFANVLSHLGVEKGDRVFSLLGRVPEMYVSVLGSLKFGSVFCPLFSVFGPEPIFQRLSKGNAQVLLTNSVQFEKKSSLCSWCAKTTVMPWELPCNTPTPIKI